MFVLYSYHLATKPFTTDHLIQMTSLQNKYTFIVIAFFSAGVGASMYVRGWSAKYLASLSDGATIEREIYGDSSPLMVTTKNLFKEFQRGRTSFSDGSRPSAPKMACTMDNLIKVHVLV